MACALSCSALCKSARMRVSATFSTERLLHKASSHMTFKRSRAYWGGGREGTHKKQRLHPENKVDPHESYKCNQLNDFNDYSSTRNGGKNDPKMSQQQAPAICIAMLKKQELPSFTT